MRRRKIVFADYGSIKRFRNKSQFPSRASGRRCGLELALYKLEEAIGTAIRPL